MTAWQLLSKPDGWTQGCAARDAAGNEVSPFSKGAVKFCLIGAILKVYGWSKLNSKLEFELKKLMPPNVVDVCLWNNAPERTQQEVVDVLKKLSL